MNLAFRLVPRGSPRLAAMFVAIHAAAFAAATVGLSPVPLAFAASGIVISGLLTAKSVLNPRAGGIEALGWDDRGAVWWQSVSCGWEPADELTAAHVSPWLTIIRIRPKTHSRRVTARWLLIGPDSATPAELRELRSRLRLT